MWVLREKLSRLWSGWELRGMVLLSLLLQIILSFLGNWRKYNNRNWIRFILWLGYLCANWVATASLGVLSSSQGDCKDDCLDPNHLIMAFWGPFLLLHLGGPDTITAYSLEDNELWQRHLLGLLTQVALALNVFVRSLKPTALNFAAIPLLIAGTIKYGERTYILRSASSEHFRESLFPTADPGPNYAKFMEEYVLKEREGFKLRWKTAEVPKNVARDYEANTNSLVPDAAILNAAHDFFLTYKRLFADLILSFQDLEKSKSFFEEGTWERAFKVIEVELGFVYDLLYTKATIFHSTWGYFLRCSSFNSTIIGLVLFCAVDWHGYSRVDVAITFLLLIGAVFLELYAFLLLGLSDWALLWFGSHTSPLMNFIYRLVSCFKFITCEKKWSNSMGQYSLISSCLKAKPTKLHKLIPKYNFIHKIIHKYRRGSSKDVPPHLKEFIFDHLASKSKHARDFSDCKQLCAARGNLVLEKNNCLDELRWSVNEVEFDHSILLWHIATDLCYFSDPNSVDGTKCKESKLLSDYALYILVKRPFMLPNGIGQIRFQDTCAEATEFFEERKTMSDVHLACKKLLQIDIKIPPADVKGDRSKSLLFDACKLAKSLQSLDNEESWGKAKRWKMVSDVWVEMLSYAASQCMWNHHAQQLRHGGELLTHIWLLMSHLGLTENFQISQGHARTKLIVR